VTGVANRTDSRRGHNSLSLKRIRQTLTTTDNNRDLRCSRLGVRQPLLTTLEIRHWLPATDKLW